MIIYVDEVGNCTAVLTGFSICGFPYFNSIIQEYTMVVFSFESC